MIQLASTTVDPFENLQSFARLLIIAKGVDFDALYVVKQEEMSTEILELFLNFIDENLSDSKNQQISDEWIEYKNSHFDLEAYNKSQFLPEAIAKLSQIFLQIK